MNFLKNLFRKKTPEEIDHDRRIRLYKKALKLREEKLKKYESQYVNTNPKIIVLKRERKQDWLKCLFECLTRYTNDNDYERFERTLRHAVQAGLSVNDPVVEYFGLQQARTYLLFYLIHWSSSYSKELNKKCYLEYVEEGTIEEHPEAYALPDMPEEHPFRTDPRYLNLLIELGANLNKIWDRDLWKKPYTALDAAVSSEYKCPEWFIQTLKDHGGRRAYSPDPIPVSITYNNL